MLALQALVGLLESAEESGILAVTLPLLADLAPQQVSTIVGLAAERLPEDHPVAAETDPRGGVEPGFRGQFLSYPPRGLQVHLLHYLAWQKGD